MSYEEFAQFHADSYSEENLAGLFETEPATEEEQEA